MSRKITERLVPRARRVLIPRPLQHLEVATVSCPITGSIAPRARRVLLPRPLEYLEFASPGC